MTIRMAPRAGLLLLTLGLLSASTGEAQEKPAPRAQLKPATTPVWSLAFAPDGKTLAAFANSFDKGTVVVWDVATGKEVLSLPLPSKGMMGSVAFSPDGKVLAAGNGNALGLWKTGDGEKVFGISDLATDLMDLAFSPDGKALAVAGGDGVNTSLEVRDAASGKTLVGLEGHAKGTFAVVFTPDGKHLATGGGDGAVRLWDAAGGKLTAKLEGHEKLIDQLALRPDGKMLASGSIDRTVRLWNLPDRDSAAVLKGLPGVVLDLAFSPDGKLLAVATGKFAGAGEVWLYDPDTAKVVAKLPSQEAPVRAVAFSPDGKTLATVCGFEPVLLWDVMAILKTKPE